MAELVLAQIGRFSDTLSGLLNNLSLPGYSMRVGRDAFPTPMPKLPSTRTVATEASAEINPYAVAKHRLLKAYSDCHTRHRSSLIPDRNLDFCCPVTVSRDEAQRLLRRYVPGYNAFQPKRLQALPSDCRVRLAREGSVCLYVETETLLQESAMRRALECDRCDLYQTWNGTRTYRLWWD